jgi:hypothetical protein
MKDRRDRPRLKEQYKDKEDKADTELSGSDSEEEDF